jgi:hypothetical protein
MPSTNSVYDFYKLKDWVDPKRIHWGKLVTRENTIPFIEKHIAILDKECLEKLSRNPFAADMLKRHVSKISWNDFVNNPNCIHVIEENIDICFNSLNSHGKTNLIRHPNFIHIIKNNVNKIIDNLLCTSILPILANQQNSIYIDLLDQYMNKYPDKIPYNASCYFWYNLCQNPYAVHIIEKYLDKLNNYSWNLLAGNSNAIHIIEHNLYRLNEFGWRNLSKNHNAIPLLEKNPDKIDWYNLSSNLNGIQILENNPDKITCYLFLDYNNISVNSCIFEVDYDTISKRCSIFKEELLAFALHPSRISAYLAYGISIEELDKYI